MGTNPMSFSDIALEVGGGKQSSSQASSQNQNQVVATNISHIALDVGQGSSGPALPGQALANIIDFCEAPWGLGMRLLPVQRIILKAHYGVPLDDVATFRLRDWRGNKMTDYTEKSYLRYLYDNGRCNIPDVTPGEELRELVLSIGRRSGKTFLAAAITAYETYKLIMKGCPQDYFGLLPTNNIQIISVATDKDQAGLLYQEASGHFRNCFAGDTEIITADGIKSIGPLAGTVQRILGRNGAWIDAPIRFFGKQSIWKLTLRRQGIEKVIYCTGDHRWFARDERGKYRGKGFAEFTTKELRPEKHRLQAVFGHSYKNIVTPSPFGIAHGFTFGDGSTTAGERNATSVVMIGDKDANLKPYFSRCPMKERPEINGVEAGSLPNYFRNLPNIRENKAYLVGWLMGYLAADGTVKSGGQVVLSSVRREHLEFVRSVCAVVGIGTYSIREETRVSNLTGRPFTMYSIGFMRGTLDDTFFIVPAHREAFLAAGGEVVRREVREWTVQSVDQTDREEDVFCATVPEQHAFVLADNIVTGNCGFFLPYTANNTQSYARFQTPYDIERYGRYAEDLTAKATLKVTFRSCIAKGLRGAGNIVVILDEMAHFTDNGQSSAEEVYKAVTPSKSTFSHKDPITRMPIPGPDGQDGVVESRVIAISSPLGRSGQFYKLYQQAMKGGRPAKGMLAIMAPTWEVNPTIPISELETEYYKDPISFFVEYGGEFSDRTRGWIEREVDLLTCISPTHRPIMSAPARRPHFVGLDIALVNDYTAISIGHHDVVDGEKVIILDYIDRIHAGEGKYAEKERLDFDDIANWIYDLSRRFYISEGIFDQWGQFPLEDALNKRGLRQLKGHKFSRPELSEIWQNFKSMMWDQRLVLYDWPLSDDPAKPHCVYISELLELQAEEHSKYIIDVHKPKIEGKSDDMSDALVRMVWLASQTIGSTKRSTGSYGSAASAVVSQARQVGALHRKALLKARQGGSDPARMSPRFQRGNRYTSGR